MDRHGGLDSWQSYSEYFLWLTHKTSDTSLFGGSLPEKGTSKNCFWQDLGASSILPKVATAIEIIIEIYK